MFSDDKCESVESILAFAERLKRRDREALAQLPADEAQAAVAKILSPRHWRPSDSSQLEWPGDLADEDEDAANS